MGVETAVSLLKITFTLYGRKPGKEWNGQEAKGIAHKEVYPEYYTRIGPRL